jgi:hypothetical protein
MRFLSFALLLALAFGVMTVAYPCAVVPRQASPAAATTSSCHDGMARHTASSAASGRHVKPRGCCDPTDRDPRVCPKACQAIALLARPATLAALEGREDVASPAAERPLPQLVAAIDHIPLA